MQLQTLSQKLKLLLQSSALLLVLSSCSNTESFDSSWCEYKDLGSKNVVMNECAATEDDDAACNINKDVTVIVDTTQVDCSKLVESKRR